MSINPNIPITDPNQAKKFLQWCCQEIGLGFHPDNSFSDYMDKNSREVFTDDVATVLNQRMDETFGIAEKSNFDVYEYCMNQPPVSQLKELQWRDRFDVMCKYFGWNHSDISNITGNSYDSVKTVLNRSEIPRWTKLSIVVFEKLEEENIELRKQSLQIQNEATHP